MLKAKEKRKDRYTRLNAEFQRIARRDKKAVLSDQCKEMEENNRMGKTRDLFKKIRDAKETFYAKMSTIKDRNDFPDCERTTGSTGEKFCFLLRLHRILGLVGWVGGVLSSSNSYADCSFFPEKY